MGTKKTLISLFLFLISITYLVYAAIHIISTSAPDFYVYYYAGEDFLHGINAYADVTLYTVFTYPPVSLVAISLLAFLPVQISQTIFVIISSLSIFALPFMSMKGLRVTHSLIALSFITACFVFSFPAKFTLGMGQINAIALLIFVIGISIKRPPLFKSLLLIIACIFKPILAFCLIIYIVRKDLRMVLYLSMWAFIALTISYASVGQETYMYYLKHIIPHLSSVAGREVYYNQGLLGFISRLIPDFQLRSALSLILSMSIVGVMIWKMLRTTVFQYQLALALSTLVIIDTLSWQHHFIFLLYPVLFIVMYLKHTSVQIIVAIAYILISINITTPGLYTTIPALLLLSHGFYGAILIWSILIFGEYAVKVRE